MNEKLVSIIIPVYNAQSTIQRVVDSLQKSQYHNLMEIICVNDGSTDLSLKILEEMHFDNLKVYTQKNNGVSSARNLGLQEASGSYVLFVDADDELFIMAFDRMMRRVVEKNHDLTIFGIRDIFHSQNKKCSTKDNYVENKEYEETTFYPNFCKFLNKDILYSPCNKVYQLSIIKENALLFDTCYAIGEDLLFNLNYFQQIHTIDMVDEFVYGYHHDVNSGESGSQRYHENEFTILLALLEEIKKLLKAKEVYESNEVEYHKFIIRKISYSINTLYFKGSPLKKEDRLAFLNTLYQNQEVQEALSDKRVKMEELDQKVLCFLHRKQMKKMILFLYDLRNKR